MKLKYSVSSVAPNFTLLKSMVFCDIRLTASFSASGTTGMDDAPVPPNTEPNTNTRAPAPLCCSSVRKAASCFSGSVARSLSSM